MLTVIILYGWYNRSKTDDRIGYIYVKLGEGKLYIDDAGLIIDAWDCYGTTYFFIPSYARISRISYERSPLNIYSVNGILLEEPIINTVQEVLVETEDGEGILYNIGFFSQTIFTLYTLIQAEK